jgi:hypothetical protein
VEELSDELVGVVALSVEAVAGPCALHAEIKSGRKVGGQITDTRAEPGAPTLRPVVLDTSGEPAAVKDAIRAHIAQSCDECSRYFNPELYEKPS